MRFSEAKKGELEKKLLLIFTDCILKARDTQNEMYVEEWYFMELVYNANLVTEPKQYFLLGQLAQKVHDIAPKALSETMRAMGLITDDSLISKCRAYWVDKYGTEEAAMLIEKLYPAFAGEKYTEEQIKSMGDKMEYMRQKMK